MCLYCSDLGCVENPEFDLEASSHVCEVQVSELLLNEPGRRSLKVKCDKLTQNIKTNVGKIYLEMPHIVKNLCSQVMYKYLKTENDWLILALGQTPPAPYCNTLLYTMFHVGGRPFDQVHNVKKWLCHKTFWRFGKSHSYT